MNLTLWDHLFAVMIFIIFPIYSGLTIGDLLREIESKGAPARIGAYKQVILTWLSFAILVFLLWVTFDRPWADLGIRAIEPLRTLIAFVAAILVVGFIGMQLRGIYRSSDRHSELDEHLGHIGILMPVSHKEESWFTAVSINAGITEEVLFRGYLIWYLQHFVGLHWAAVLAVLLFGLAHSYQGIKQLPGILMIAAVAVGLYVFSGSLLVPIIFHIALDAIQGFYIARIQRARIENL